MRLSNWALNWWLVLLVVCSGCNCQPPGDPDGVTPLSLTWPEGARLEVTSTTEQSAELRWPEAVGPVATYRLAWPGNSREETGLTASLSGLSLGVHLPVEVMAVAADGTASPPGRITIGWGRNDRLLLPRQAARAQAAFPTARLHWRAKTN